jgi:hypothetical protein
MESLSVRVVHFHGSTLSASGHAYFQQVKADEAALKNGHMSQRDADGGTMRSSLARVLHAFRYMLKHGDGAEGLSREVVRFNAFFPLALIRESCGAYIAVVMVLPISVFCALCQWLWGRGVGVDSCG